MSFIRALLKLFLACAILAAIAFGAMAAYMTLYGNDHIKAVLGKLVGAPVEFKAIALNLEKQAASFKGFSIASAIGFDKHIFDADTFTVILNKDKLKAEGRLAFDRVYVKGAKLIIIRDKRGVLNLDRPALTTAALPAPSLGFASVAHAAEAPPKNPLYGLAKSVREITIEDSMVVFEDHYRMAGPYSIWCNKFYARAASGDSGAGYMTTTVTAGLRLPQRQYGEGWFGAKASLAIYPDRTNAEAVAETGNIDLRLFQPYLQRGTPFSARSGRFGSRTDFRMHDGAVDSLTTMHLSDLDLLINMNDPNAQFLQVSINRLAPYLRSGGNIVFDFVVKGSASKPQFGAGPKVKFAIGMVVMEEVGKAIAQMQRAQ